MCVNSLYLHSECSAFTSELHNTFSAQAEQVKSCFHLLSTLLLSCSYRYDLNSRGESKSKLLLSELKLKLHI